MTIKTMMKAAAPVVLAASCAAWGADACKGHDHGNGHGHEHGEAHGMSVEVSESAAKAMGLKTVRVAKRRMRSTVSLLGRVELAPEARRSEASPAAGRVSVKVRQFQEVKPGDVLFTVDAPELRTRTAEIAILERRLNAYRALNRASAELEAQLALRKAEREAMLSGAVESDGRVKVCASEAGRVSALLVVNGAAVAAGDGVVEIMRPNMLRFKALVPTVEASKLRDGMKVLQEGLVGRLQVGLGDDAGLTSVFAVFEEGALAARPGERLRVDCVTDESETPAVAVPGACIVRVGLEPTVFVQDEADPDRYNAMKVEPGRSGGGWTEVKGLPDDDDLEIVKEGAYELKIALAARQGASPAGHFHADGTFHEGKDEP